MTKAYFTLCRFDAEESREWFDVFGDTSRAEVQGELDTLRGDGVPAKHLRIIKSDGTARDMMEKRDALPRP